MAYGDKEVLRVVAMEGSAGDWVAYVGPADWDGIRYLGRAGGRLPEEVAVPLFRLIDSRLIKLPYRR